jgi:hypothetical protein
MIINATLTRKPNSALGPDLKVAKPESIHLTIPWQYKWIGPL